MHLNTKLLQLLGLRFADENYDIDFDDYLTCIVRLENMFSEYQGDCNTLWDVAAQITCIFVEQVNTQRCLMLWSCWTYPMLYWLLTKNICPPPGVFQALDKSKTGQVNMNILQV